ncbi:hypothetical protein H7J07_05580 [Mycobacterium koreense]|nr:hypothetical protein [Mycolicibacillus koreensis]MCV7247695.1 hypothetical protein [Mycolicibacillus koreensis]BBY54080.1 hypothetical protein MKOR_13310 [Mycolicibacillus koreensis]
MTGPNSGTNPPNQTAQPRGWEMVEKYAGVSKPSVDELRQGNVTKGLKAIGKDQWNAGQRAAGKIGDAAAHAAPTALGKAGVKAAAKAVPVLGSAYAAYSAVSHFKDGDVVGGLLNVVGVVPGPIGWVGLGLSTAWDIFGGGSGYGMWDAPDGTSTHMLPAAAADEAGVADVDAALTAAQRGVFAFQDGPQGSVWNSSPPDPLRLDTDTVQAAVKNHLQGIADVFAQIDQLMKNSGEPYLMQYRQKLQPHFAAMAKLPDRAKDIADQLTAASDGAQSAYQAVTAANRAARSQLSTDGSLTDPGPATQMRTQLEKAGSVIGQANEKLANVFSDSPAAPLVPNYGTPGRHRDTTKDKGTEKPKVEPKPTVPAAHKPDTKPTDTKPTVPSMPKAPAMPNLGGMPRMGGNPGNSLGTPHSGGGGPKPLLGEQSRPKHEPKPLLDDEKKDEKPKDKPKLSTATDAANRKAAAAKPGEEKKPETKAGPQKAAAPKPGEKPEAKPDGPKEVDVKGKKVAFPDAKTAKMAQLLSGADPAHPMSLSDAAAKAGLTPPVPGHDPGQQVPPTDARPGDVLVAGDRQFMVLGDGQFYDLSEFKIVGADALPADLGDRGGYFRLPDAGDAAASPVSGPTDDPAAFAVPGGTPPAAEPSDASAAPPPAPGAVPGAAPPSPAGPGSVPSQGTPGVPSEGDGGGPANAESTDTGGVDAVPSTGTSAMDPGAVK